MGTVTRMELRKIDELLPYENNAKRTRPSRSKNSAGASGSSA